MLSEKAARIKQELKSVGATAFGLSKFSSKFLPKILHDGEHIQGAVYGRYATGSGLLRWTEGMLVATDRRVIFLDRKPGFETMDELAYEVISGVQKMYAWPFSSVTLRTKIGDYTLRFANSTCIDIFMHYIEMRRLESTGGKVKEDVAKVRPFAQAVRDFLAEHDVAVLSTENHVGEVFGAAIHYTVVGDSYIYLLTKAETHKANNLIEHPQVALTVFDENSLRSLQIQGTATIEKDHNKRDYVFRHMSLPRTYGSHKESPPVTHLERGAYVVVKITPTSVLFSDFHHSDESSAQ